MNARPIDEVTKRDVEALLVEESRESRTLEYKSALPGAGDSDKREFLADVSSFANASEGNLWYGIRAKDGVPKEIVGLPGVNQDAEVLRLESSIQSGIAPRIPGVRMRFIEGFDDGPVLLLRVPRSWAGPHMVTFQGLSRFYSRTSAGKYPLDVTEIRAAFALSEALPDRIRRFRDDRLARIVAGETPVPLEDNPKIILHVMPLSAFSSAPQLQTTAMKALQTSLSLFGAGGWDTRINIDGLLNYSGPGRETDKHRAYCQAFRSGVIEAVDANMIRCNGNQIIPMGPFEHGTVAAVGDYLKFLAALDVPLPAIVMVALIGVHGYHAIPPYVVFPDRKPVDRDMLTLPEVLIEDSERPLPAVLRPLFDGLWNAGGYERSFNFTEDGIWKPR